MLKVVKDFGLNWQQLGSNSANCSYGIMLFLMGHVCSLKSSSSPLND